MIILFYNRPFKNKLASFWMTICFILVVSLPIIIGIGLAYKSSMLIGNHTLGELLLGQEWKPGENKFGFLPFIMGSVWVTVLSVVISAPICLLTAIYMTQYSKKFFLSIIHPAIDILAGIPSVVYGVWGVLAVVPFIGDVLAPALGLNTMGYSILAGALVLGVMIIPFMLNILIEVFRTIPVELSEAALSLGATKWQTIKLVLIRKALPGILAALGFGIARAFGETMAVLMVVGNVVQIPKSPMDQGYPLPALIANNYGEMMSIPQYDSALMFAALILMVVVIFFNVLMRKFIMKYEKF